MSPKRVHPVLRLPAIDALQDALQKAEWRYNADADEMNVLLPGWEGRPGHAVLIDDAIYVRLDVQTGALLSLFVPAYTFWHAEQLAQPRVRESLPLLTGRLDADPDAERHALAAVVARALHEGKNPADAATTTAWTNGGEKNLVLGTAAIPAPTTTGLQVLSGPQAVHVGPLHEKVR